MDSKKRKEGRQTGAGAECGWGRWGAMAGAADMKVGMSVIN